MDGMADPIGAPSAARGADAALAHAEAPFTLVEPLRRTAPIVFASPHSGRRYPAGLLAQSRLGLSSLRRSEDPFVDELFAGAPRHGAALICATVARAYVDLNRDPDELDPDMFIEPLARTAATASPRVQAGLGAVPRISGDGEAIYRQRISLAEARGRIAEVHAPYHAMLRNLVAETNAAFGCAILIDCHSMPGAGRQGGGADVILGDRFGAACHPSVTAFIEQALRRMGYRVARNAPFAGGHTTQAYGRPHQNVHAIQIELSRSLYLQERTLTRSLGYERVRTDMAKLAEALAAAELHRKLG
jgi:N-formylglutamate deformylase